VCIVVESCDDVATAGCVVTNMALRSASARVVTIGGLSGEEERSNRRNLIQPKEAPFDGWKVRWWKRAGVEEKVGRTVRT